MDGGEEFIGKVIFWVLVVAVVVTAMMAKVIMGPFNAMRRAEKIVAIALVVGSITTIILAAIQLLWRFLI
jgi:uncharacterized sodium:solute symporter family permease YidK